MIAEKVLDVFYSFLEWLFGLIPEFALPPEFVEGALDVVKWCYWINNYIPLDTLAIIIPAVCAVWILAGAGSAVLQLL